MPAAGEPGGGVGGVGQNWIRAARFAILCVLQSIQYRSSFCLRFLVSAPLWQEWGMMRPRFCILKHLTLLNGCFLYNSAQLPSCQPHVHNNNTTGLHTALKLGRRDCDATQMCPPSLLWHRQPRPARVLWWKFPWAPPKRVQTQLSNTHTHSMFDFRRHFTDLKKLNNSWII